MSADKFGEETYIKNGKVPGGLKELTMSGDWLAIWVESYPICAHVTLAIESMHSADEEMEEKREEGENRLMLDTDDRNRVYEELMKHSHPLKITSPSLIINGKVVNASVTSRKPSRWGRACSLTSGRHYLVVSTLPWKEKSKLWNLSNAA